MEESLSVSPFGLQLEFQAPTFLFQHFPCHNSNIKFLHFYLVPVSLTFCPTAPQKYR